MQESEGIKYKLVGMLNSQHGCRTDIWQAAAQRCKYSGQNHRSTHNTVQPTKKKNNNPALK